MAGWCISMKSGAEISDNDLTAFKASIPEFTAKSDREMGWTSENIEKRLEVVSVKFSRDLIIPLFCAIEGIYRNASEILHGTYFGSLFMLGLTDLGRRAPGSGAQLKIELLNHQFGVLSPVNFSIVALLQGLSECLNIDSFAEVGDAAMQQLRELSVVQESLRRQDGSSAEVSEQKE